MSKGHLTIPKRSPAELPGKLDFFRHSSCFVAQNRAAKVEGSTESSVGEPNPFPHFPWENRKYRHLPGTPNNHFLMDVW